MHSPFLVSMFSLLLTMKILYSSQHICIGLRALLKAWGNKNIEKIFDRKGEGVKASL